MRLMFLQILVAGHRATLRRGDDYPEIREEVPQKGVLVAVPLFHVTGMTSFSVRPRVCCIPSRSDDTDR